tara:strand:- start:1231 stop:2013 length:783 start_codon:yes stop_codon:yes gene_type:complete
VSAIELKFVEPRALGFIECKLPQEYIDYLWERIEVSKDKDFKSNLAGNISESYALEDKDNFFFTRVAWKVQQAYVKKFGDIYASRRYTFGMLKDAMGSFWWNRQNKHEFNPYHHHNGTYSFVIWLKIPTKWEDQKDLPFLQGIKLKDRRASNFEFEYTNGFGEIVNYAYQLSPEFEGTMLFFPAGLRHTVYPYYDNDESRVTVSGNLVQVPVTDSEEINSVQQHWASQDKNFLPPKLHPDPPTVLYQTPVSQDLGNRTGK